MNRRKIDKLGRIVIPMDYRKALQITEDTMLEINISEGSIQITPIVNSCKICGALTDFHEDIPLCSNCIKRIKHV